MKGIGSCSGIRNSGIVKLLILALLTSLLITGCSMLGQKQKTPGQKPGTNQADKGPAADQPKTEKEYYIGLDAPVEGLKEWVDRYKSYDVVLIQKLGKYRVLLISMGEKFSPGYDVKINKVKKEPGIWEVEVVLTQPREEDYSGKSVYPFEVVSIIDDGKPVEVFKKDDNTAVKVSVVEIPAGKKLGVSKNFIVFTPYEGETIANPVLVKGKGRIFEGSFRLTLEDGHNQLAKKFMMTDNGAPAWGNFVVDLAYEKPTNPSGHLILSWDSPENGQLIEELLLPVKF